MSTLICVHGFQIHNMMNNTILINDAVTTMHITSINSNIKKLITILRTLEKSIQLDTDWHPSNVPFVSNPVSLVLFQCPYQQVSFELTDWLPKDDQLFTS